MYGWLGETGQASCALYYYGKRQAGINNVPSVRVSSPLAALHFIRTKATIGPLFTEFQPTHYGAAYRCAANRLSVMNLARFVWPLGELRRALRSTPRRRRGCCGASVIGIRRD